MWLALMISMLHGWHLVGTHDVLDLLMHAKPRRGERMQLGLLLRMWPGAWL